MLPSSPLINLKMDVDVVKPAPDSKTVSGFYLCEMQQYLPEQSTDEHTNNDVLNLNSQHSLVHAATQVPTTRLPEVLIPGEETFHNVDHQILAQAAAGIQTTEIPNITTLGNISASEKVAIYRHPLFPLLRVLFEKCEIATNSIEHVSSLNFDQEIKVFITQMAKENKPFFTEDPEVDTLVNTLINNFLAVKHKMIPDNKFYNERKLRGGLLG